MKRKNTAVPAPTLTAAQGEYLAKAIECGLSTRSHARMVVRFCKNASAALLKTLSNGTAGLTEANEVRKLLGISTGAMQ